MKWLFTLFSLLFFLLVMPTFADSLPPHDGYDVNSGGCGPQSICYTGNFNQSYLYPGMPCGTLPNWHFGVDKSNPKQVPACGLFNRAYCCDAGAGSIQQASQQQAKANETQHNSPQCSQFANGACVSVNTALGPIQTNVGSLVSVAFRILLSLGGGVAVILIIASGYQMMISQGNPEKVKEARERLTSAIIGLLFMIFSTTILQIIGVDILNLPGFGK